MRSRWTEFAACPARECPSGRPRCHARSIFIRAVASTRHRPTGVVYFPSCAARTMGAQRGDEESEALPVVAERLFAKAGFEVVYPERLGDLCCGQPFESKGLFEAAERKSAELEAALRDASENGRLPIVFDTSPCTYRMQRYLAGGCRCRTASSSSTIAFCHGSTSRRSRCRWQFTRCAACARWEPSTSLRQSRRTAAVEVVQVDEVLCCGFAGDKGFNRPELNEHALRHLKAALPSRCVQRLFVQSHLRDRPVGVFRLSLPVAHSPRRPLRDRAARAPDRGCRRARTEATRKPMTSLITTETSPGRSTPCPESLS